MESHLRYPRNEHTFLVDRANENRILRIVQQVMNDSIILKVGYIDYFNKPNPFTFHILQVVKMKAMASALFKKPNYVS